MPLLNRLLSLSLMLAAVGNAQADDAKDARLRRAKAALALAGTAEAAPMPKLALLSYAEGSKLAIEKTEPLIVFVDAPRKDCPKGSVCAKVDALPNYPARCVVVSYPSNGKLIESKTLSENATVAEVLVAFEEAKKKAQAANPKSSESPQDEWFITADVDDGAEEIADPPKLVTPPKLLPKCTGPNCPNGQCGQQAQWVAVPGGFARASDCACGAGCACGAMNARASAAITGFGRPHLFHGGHVRGFVHRVAGRLFHRR